MAEKDFQMWYKGDDSNADCHRNFSNYIDCEMDQKYK